MNNGIKKSIIAGCFAVVVALISVFGPRLFSSTASNLTPTPTTSLTDCGKGVFVQQGNPCPSSNGTDTPGRGTAVKTCENWKPHQSGQDNTEPINVDVPSGCTLVAWGINVQLGSNLQWISGGVGAIKGPVHVSGTIYD